MITIFSFNHMAGENWEYGGFLFLPSPLFSKNISFDHPTENNEKDRELLQNTTLKFAKLSPALTAYYFLDGAKGVFFSSC